MSLFKSRFTTLLEQDEDEIAPIADEQENPLEGELQQGVEPEDFGADVGPVDNAGEDAVANAKEASLSSQKTELSEWINQIEEFIEYINGVNTNSIQSRLHNASCDTLFEKIASSEHRRLSRVAVELSALAEAFKGYLIAGE